MKTTDMKTTDMKTTDMKTTIEEQAHVLEQEIENQVLALFPAMRGCPDHKDPTATSVVEHAPGEFLVRTNDGLVECHVTEREHALGARSRFEYTTVEVYSDDCGDPVTVTSMPHAAKVFVAMHVQMRLCLEHPVRDKFPRVWPKPTKVGRDEFRKVHGR